jgi:hypothetical protein
MRSPVLRNTVLSLIILTSAALCGPSLAQDTNQIVTPAQQERLDKLAFDDFGQAIESLSGHGNLLPSFSSLAILKAPDPSGNRSAGYLRLVKADDKYAFGQTHWYNELPIGQAGYGLYFDGFAGILSPNVDWKPIGDFPRKLRTGVTLLTKGVGTPKSETLYVSDVTDTYPGFEWLKGPFSIIRRQGDDKVYAIWSAALNWPVYTADWEVEGAYLDGKGLGQADMVSLAKVAADKGFSTEQTRLAQRRAAFENQLRVKQAAQGGPADVLPQYKGQAIRDPEAEMANTYIPGPATVAGATAVSAVNVRITSPALWTVSRGNRKVYILGAPWLFREDVDWNKVRLTNRLRAAQRGRLILPPVLEDYYDKTVDPALDTDAIPDAYKDRVRKAAAAIGQPAERYLNLSPFMASYRLTTDFRAGAGLKRDLVTIQVAKIAQTIALAPSLAGAVGGPNGNAGGPPSGAGLACLDAVLDEVEAGKPAVDRAMEAWANGDVRMALTAPRGLERCSFAFPGEAETRQDGITAEVEAIEASLSPGGAGASLRSNAASVAVVYLRTLLSVDGVLARLQAQGYKIEAPA